MTNELHASKCPTIKSLYNNYYIKIKKKKQTYIKITFRQVSRYTNKFGGQISTIVPLPLGISIGPGSDSGMQMAYRYLSVLAQGLTELVH